MRRFALGRTAATWLLAAAAVGAAAGCRLGTQKLDPDELSWKTYADPLVGYSLSYPEAFAPDRRASGAYVGFRYSGTEPVVVRFVTEEEGRRAGLWFGVPAEGGGVLGGKPAERFVYRHYDGPFGRRMIAWVVPWRGRYLAVELRTDAEPSAVQLRILESFTLE